MRLVVLMIMAMTAVDVSAQQPIPEPDVIFRLRVNGNRPASANLAWLESLDGDGEIFDQGAITAGESVLRVPVVNSSNGAAIIPGTTQVPFAVRVNIGSFVSGQREGVLQGTAQADSRGTIYDVRVDYQNTAQPGRTLPVTPIGGAVTPGAPTATPTGPTPTPPPTNTRRSPTPTITPTGTPSGCFRTSMSKLVGDCNDNGQLKASEIQIMIYRVLACGGSTTASCSVALNTGALTVPACGSGEFGTPNGSISASDIQRAILNSLALCQ